MTPDTSRYTNTVRQLLQYSLFVWPVYKVSIETDVDDMEGLRGFVKHMATHFPDEQSRNDFHSLTLVAFGSSSSPEEVSKAVEVIKKEAGANRSILASFKAIAQGKKLLSLCEEAHEGRAHINEACQVLEKIVSECDTAKSALGGIDLDKSISQFATALNNYKAAIPATKNVSEDAAVKDRIRKAKESLLDLCKSTTSAYCQRDVLQWIETQVKTLKASRVMSKPPASGIGNMKASLDKIFGENCVPETKSLQDFLNQCTLVAEETDTWLRMTDDTDKQREVAVRICQKSEALKQTIQGLNCSFPFLFTVTDEMNQAMQQLVQDVCTKLWHSSMSLPQKTLIQIATDNSFGSVKATQEEQKELVIKSSKQVSDARLLLTGLPQSDSARKNLEQAAMFLERLLKVSETAFQPESKLMHAEGLRLMFELRNEMGIVDGFHGLNKKSAGDALPACIAEKMEKLCSIEDGLDGFNCQYKYKL